MSKIRNWYYNTTTGKIYKFITGLLNVIWLTGSLFVDCFMRLLIAGVILSIIADLPYTIVNPDNLKIAAWFAILWIAIPIGNFFRMLYSDLKFELIYKEED